MNLNNLHPNFYEVTVYDNQYKILLKDFFSDYYEKKGNFSKIKQKDILKHLYVLTNNLDLIKNLITVFSLDFDKIINEINTFDKLDYIYYTSLDNKSQAKNLFNLFKIDKVKYYLLNKVIVEFNEKEFENIVLLNKIDGDNKKYLTAEKEFIYEKINSLKNTNHLTIHSPTGSGKTSLIIEMIRENKFKKVLFIAPTTSLNLDVYNACNDANIKTYLAMGKNSRERKNITSENYNLIENQKHFISLLTSKDNFIITMDTFFYSYLFNGVIKNKSLELLEKNNITIVVDEYHKVGKSLENKTNGTNKDGKIINFPNMFKCVYKNMFYIFLSATAKTNSKGQEIATNVLDYISEKTNIKNIQLAEKNYFKLLLLQKLQNKENIVIYAQNKEFINEIKKEYKKNYNGNIASLTSQTVETEKKLFFDIAKDENINKYVLCLTSAGSEGISIRKNVTNFFIDCTIHTEKDDLLQILGRVRGKVETCYITVRTSTKEINENDIEIAKDFLTTKGLPILDTNLIIKPKTSFWDTGFLNSDDLIKLLKSKKYITNFLETKTSSDKIKTTKSNKKDKIINTLENLTQETINTSELLTLGLKKDLFSNIGKTTDNKLIDKSYYVLDIIEALENDYNLDFKTNFFLENLENILNKNKEKLTNGVTSTDFKNLVTSDLKILNFCKDYLFDYKRLNKYRLFSLKNNFVEILNNLKSKDILINGKLNQYNIFNYAETYKEIPIFLELNNNVINKNKLKQYGYTTKIENNKITGILKNRIDEKIEIPSNEIIHKNKINKSLDIIKFLKYISNDEILAIDIETKRQTNKIKIDDINYLLDDEKHFNYKTIEYIVPPKNKKEHKKNLNKSKLLLNPYYSYISNINFYNKNGFYGLELTEKNYKETIKNLFEIIKDKKIIIHNINMEFRFFKQIENFDNFFKNNNFYDTLFLDNIIKLNRSSSLKTLTYSWSGDKYSDKENSNRFYDLEYMFKDVYYTYHIFKKLRYRLENKQQKTLHDTFINFFYYLQDKPLQMDTNLFINNVNFLQLELKSQKEKIKEFATPQKLLLFYKNKYNISLQNSQKKVLEKLMKDNVISENQTAEIKEFLKYKEIETILNDYLKLNNKFLIPSYSHLITGRMSTSSPNFQGFSKKQIELNGVKITSPKSLFRLFESDYNQLEICVGAVMYNLKDFTKAVNNNKDLHSLTGSKLSNNKFSYENIVEANKNKDLGKAYNKECINFRNIAKIFNFGLMYGMGVNGLFETLNKFIDGITVDEVQEMYNNFTKNDIDMFKVLEEKNNIDFKAYDSILLKSNFGRKRLFCHLFDNNYINTKMINYPIQSSASDLNIFSVVAYCKKYNKKIIATVHDAIYTDGVAEKENIKKMMVETAKKYFSKINIKTGE